MNKIIIYLILIFCICYDAIIQSILAYIFGYCFGHFIYEIIRKKLKKKKLKNFFLLTIRNMASKEVTTTENNWQRMTINENHEKKFLNDLELKLSLLFGDFIVSCLIRDQGMAFSLETFPLAVEMVTKLLEVIDDHITEYFFISGLSKLGWCTRYLMDSSICFNKIVKDSDKFKKIQIIEFYWMKKKTQCQCFNCFHFSKQSKSKKEELKNV